MTVITNKNIALAIYQASKGKSQEEQSLLAKKAVQFLIKKRLVPKAKEIISYLNKIINEHEGRVVATVSSAEKISEAKNKELAQVLARRFSAKEIDMEEKVDEKLLGGFKIEVNDEVIDLTIKNRMNKLQEHLIKIA
jgi:ATP synthase F1 delta subunit